MVSVFVDLGAQYTTVIIGKGQEIAFIKQIPLPAIPSMSRCRPLGISVEEAAVVRARLQTAQRQGGSGNRRAVTDAMSSCIETLAHEISLCFRYYAVTFRGRRPVEAAFTGGEAHESSLMEACAGIWGGNQDRRTLAGYDLTRANFDRRCTPRCVNGPSRSDWP